MVQRKLKHDMKEAEEEQRLQTGFIIQEIQGDKAYKQDDNNSKSETRYPVPLYHRGFWKPVKIMIAVSKSNDASKLYANLVAEYSFIGKMKFAQQGLVQPRKSTIAIHCPVADRAVVIAKQQCAKYGTKKEYRKRKITAAALAFESTV